MSAVGFEPTSANTVELESTPLDRSGTLTIDNPPSAPPQHKHTQTIPHTQRLTHPTHHHTHTATLPTNQRPQITYSNFKTHTHHPYPNLNTDTHTQYTTINQSISSQRSLTHLRPTVTHASDVSTIRRESITKGDSCNQLRTNKQPPHRAGPS